MSETSHRHHRHSFATFFINRPVFAWVIALLVMIAGTLSVINLPISQYPAIAPPTITITATYPGASAKTIEDTVTQIIESKMKGLDNLMYMSATSESTGQANITLTFKTGTDADIAQMQIQNKLQAAMTSLPEAVQRQGIQVAKSVRNFLMVVGFISPDNTFSATDLGDYIGTHIVDPISRLDGVGEVMQFSAEYALRVWLDPYKLANHQLIPSDIVNAIRTHNAVVTAGQLGDAPAPVNQPINVVVNLQSRLKNVSEFEQIVIKTAEDGTSVTLSDVARVEIGAESYARAARYKGSPAAGFAVKTAANANALETAEKVMAKLEELAPFFPEGMSYVKAYDTTPFIKLSIEGVVQTLIEAIILVVLIMYLFLGNVRATLIPTITVPVVLLGTFGILSYFGYSINTLTMFAMVLAIGLLVDDAIVVVENVERVMHQENLPAKEATHKSMNQISGALIGIGLVLSAVFLPMAFFPGSAGVIYQQFAVTIVSAMVLSVLAAFILTPALCATLLKPVDKTAESKGFFGWFNRQFDRGTHAYGRGVKGIIRHRFVFFAVYLLIVGSVGYLYAKTPAGFLPNEDQGMLLSQVMMPSGATQEDTLEVVKKLEHHYLDTEKDNIEALFTVIGFNFSGTGQNTAIAFVRLKDWSERTDPSRSVNAIAGRAMGTFSQIKEAMVFAFAPPPVMELGNAMGFNFYVKDTGGVGREQLYNARNQMLGMASQNPNLVGVRPNGQEPAAVLSVQVNKQKAQALGLSIADINQSLSIAWGRAYVDDFIKQGKVKRIYVQSEAKYRSTPDNFNDWYVRNKTGDMIPVSAFVEMTWVKESPKLERYNGQAALQILGMSPPHISSGEAMDTVEALSQQLPKGVSIEWTGLSYEEKAAGEKSTLLYILSILVVFLCLAALYESWTLPISVILIVPLGVLGTLFAAHFFAKPSDIYFQVGLLTIVGLATKNAILIVEFSKDLVEEGMDVIEATIQAAKMRLRPILITSLAFGFGVLPLALSSGAGSGAHNAIGTAVLGGMISATALGIFLVPLFFVLMYQWFQAKTVTN